MFAITSCTVWILAGLSATPVLSRGFEGLSGYYCATRGGCCSGRIDDCSVQVFDTLCYCDDFCNRTNADDCCPDYWRFCLGEDKFPEECISGGKVYRHNEVVKNNCNICKCSANYNGKAQFICEQNICLVEEAVLTGINGDRFAGWRAANYSAFWGRTLADGITFRTGTLEPHETVKSMQPVMMKDPQRTPRSFDARIKWPNLVGEATDQGWCGSSWALSTAAVASDRFGIMSAGRATVRLSARHLLSCNRRGQQGCQGGHLSRAWMYIRKYGLVDEDCYQWVGVSDAHCRTKHLIAKCRQQSRHFNRTETYKVGPAYRIQGEQNIMQEIMASGPVQATMKVYQDLFAYKSGVYKKSLAGSSSTFGYHSVKIIGWGEDKDLRGTPIKYWLVVNSWGPYWGENGLFRILRGVNECEIEEFVLAAWSKPNDADLPILPMNNNESNDII